MFGTSIIFLTFNNSHVVIICHTPYVLVVMAGLIIL